METPDITAARPSPPAIQTFYQSAPASRWCCLVSTGDRIYQTLSELELVGRAGWGWSCEAGITRYYWRTVDTAHPTQCSAVQHSTTANLPTRPEPGGGEGLDKNLCTTMRPPDWKITSVGPRSLCPAAGDAPTGHTRVFYSVAQESVSCYMKLLGNCVVLYTVVSGAAWGGVRVVALGRK